MKRKLLEESFLLFSVMFLPVNKILSFLISYKYMNTTNKSNLPPLLYLCTSASKTKFAPQNIKWNTSPWFTTHGQMHTREKGTITNKAILKAKKQIYQRFKYRVHNWPLQLFIRVHVFLSFIFPILGFLKMTCFLFHCNYFLNQ